MKLQFAILVIVVLAGFLLIGRIIFGRSGQESKKALVILNTRYMTEADNSVVDLTMGPTVAGIYLAGKEEATNNTAPQADAFVCVSTNKSDSTKTDTIILLDTQLRHSDKDADKPAKFCPSVKPAKKLNECRVLIPEKLLKRFETYKYKYGNIILVTDD
jgi:hypothetical protein